MAGAAAATREGLIPARAGRSSRSAPAGRRPRAHPRAGGAVRSCPRTRQSWRGSSPRGRGGHESRAAFTDLPGLIPARAGRSSGFLSIFVSAGAHPRAGGAVVLWCPSDSSLPGSSPRGRGGLMRAGTLTASKGLIPARAGRSSWTARPSCASRAHPRAGGAVRRTCAPTSSPAGSSPRGRGGQQRTSGRVLRAGLIPARAGRSSRSGAPPRRARAHPRAGGAVSCVLPQADSHEGSSPRGRGGHSSAGRQVQGSGLIPARAGRSAAARSAGTTRRAHPRAGGAVQVLGGDLDIGAGSSPRGRGGPGGIHRAHRAHGLIPARAGRSRRHTSRTSRSWAHPRAGGAVSSGLTVGCAVPGSSPRGRGGLRSARLRGALAGLIPARAGRSPRTRRRKTRPWAHPRAGGAVDVGKAVPTGARGSSPRGRGGPVGVIAQVDRGASGSSPRGRGGLDRDGDARHRRGLIPARAGRSQSASPFRAAPRAHPRAGGAVSARFAVPSSAPGSSPRGRGGLRPLDHHRSRAGLIPARAGRSGGRHAQGRHRRAHPRAGGAVGHHHAPHGLARGSSPRGRGGPL